MIWNLNYIHISSLFLNFIYILWHIICCFAENFSFQHFNGWIWWYYKKKLSKKYVFTSTLFDTNILHLIFNYTISNFDFLLPIQIQMGICTEKPVLNAYFIFWYTNANKTQIWYGAFNWCIVKAEHSLIPHSKILILKVLIQFRETNLIIRYRIYINL
jgi:hypothetical protein